MNGSTIKSNSKKTITAFLLLLSIGFINCKVAMGNEFILGSSHLPYLASSPNIGKYHSQLFIDQYLQYVSAYHKSLVKLKTLGRSSFDKKINYLIISKNGFSNSAPAILLNAAQHGDEPCSTELALAMIDYLIHHNDQEPIRSLLQNFNIFIVPVVNPDGFAINERLTFTNQDINRQFPSPVNTMISNQVQETINLKRLQDDIQFYASISYHSGIKAILWPFGFTEKPIKDDHVFRKLTAAAAQAINAPAFQSYFDYQTIGEYIDYAYWQHHSYAVTFEISEHKRPSEGFVLAKVISDGLRASLEYLKAVNDHFHKRLPDSELTVLQHFFKPFQQISTTTSGAHK